MNKETNHPIHLSVALAVHNEAAFLDICLASVQELADEIVIADAASTDTSPKIARKYGAHILTVPHEQMFHINKQRALKACKGDWVLLLDADEWISDDLRQQILDVVQYHKVPGLNQKQQRLFTQHQQQIEQRDGVKYQLAKDSLPDGFFLPRVNYFLGEALRHGGVYPDGVIRLVRRQKASYPCRSVHEQPVVKGAVGWLSADLLHNSDPTLSRYWQRADRYTSLTAQEMEKSNLKLSMFNTIKYVFWLPVWTFFWRSTRHKAILDGIPGVLFALFSGLHYALAYFKYWERKHV